MNGLKEIDLDDFLEFTDEEKKLFEVKGKISKVVYSRMKEKRVTMKKISDEIEGIGTAQVSRIVHGENYNIQTLIKVLDYLGLDIDIVPKKGKE